MAAAVANIADRIVSTPGIVGGKPCIVGTRFSVIQVAIYHLVDGMSIAEIAADFELKIGDVHAAMAFYYANGLLVEQYLAEEEVLMVKLKKRFPSRLTAVLHG